MVGVPRVRVRVEAVKSIGVLNDLDNRLKRELLFYLEAADVAAFDFSSSARCCCYCHVLGRLNPRAHNSS